MKTVIVLCLLALVLTTGVFFLLPPWMKILVIVGVSAAVFNFVLRLIIFIANPDNAVSASGLERFFNALGFTLRHTFADNNGLWLVLFTSTVICFSGAFSAQMNRPLFGEIGKGIQVQRQTSETAQQWSNWFSEKGFKTDKQLPVEQRQVYSPAEEDWNDWPWGWTTFWLFVLTAITLPLALIDEGQSVLVRINQRLHTRVQAGHIALSDNWLSQLAYRLSTGGHEYVQTAVHAGAVNTSAPVTTQSASGSSSPSLSKTFLSAFLAELVGELFVKSFKKP